MIRVYSLAKTITDCFKFRHKVGDSMSPWKRSRRPGASLG